MGWAGGQAGLSAWLGAAAMVGMWVAVVATSVWFLARATRTQHQPASTMVPVRTTLDRRFLSGEIDAETYARARRALEGEHLESLSSARR